MFRIRVSSLLEGQKAGIMRKKAKAYLSLIVSMMMIFFIVAQNVIPVQAAEEGEEKASYEADAVAIDLKLLPGVYTVKAKVGDGPY